MPSPDSWLPGLAPSQIYTHSIHNRDSGGGDTPDTAPASLSAKDAKDATAAGSELGTSTKMTPQTGVQTEDQKVGEVSLALFVKYLRAGGVGMGSFALGLALLSQVFSVITDYWLKCKLNLSSL